MKAVRCNNEEDIKMACQCINVDAESLINEVRPDIESTFGYPIFILESGMYFFNECDDDCTIEEVKIDNLKKIRL